MHITEVWRPVKGFEGRYEVSNYGRIKSLNYCNRGYEKILSPSKDHYGYLFISLGRGGRNKKVHRLVAEAFLPNPNNLPEVNHKDENRANNAVWNLEWCDRKYNMNYGTCREKIGRNREIPIIQSDLEGNFIRRWKSISEAKRSGYSKWCIICCCKNIYSQHSGYKWSYAS